MGCSRHAASGERAEERAAGTEGLFGAKYKTDAGVLPGILRSVGIRARTACPIARAGKSAAAGGTNPFRRSRCKSATAGGTFAGKPALVGPLGPPRHPDREGQGLLRPTLVHGTDSGPWMET